MASALRSVPSLCSARFWPWDGGMGGTGLSTKVEPHPLGTKNMRRSLRVRTWQQHNKNKRPREAHIKRGCLDISPQSFQRYVNEDVKSEIHHECAPQSSIPAI